MNYESLNDNVMLVELTQDEMKHFNITYDSLDSNNELTESAIKSILEEICESKAHSHSKITIEALPTDTGGCFFIFTFSKKKQRYKVKKTNKNVFFVANSLNVLLDSVLSAKKLSKNQSPCKVFALNNAFYIQLSHSHMPLRPIFKEFGSITDSISQEILSEHGKYMGELYI